LRILPPTRSVNSFLLDFELKIGHFGFFPGHDVGALERVKDYAGYDAPAS
jgi:hypothetical protein